MKMHVCPSKQNQILCTAFLHNMIRLTHWGSTGITRCPGDDLETLLVWDISLLFTICEIFYLARVLSGSKLYVILETITDLLLGRTNQQNIAKYSLSYSKHLLSVRYQAYVIQIWPGTDSSSNV